MSESSKIKLQGDLATLFKVYRERSGLSQKELAERMGVPQPAVARIETGEVGISSVTLAKFCKATGLKINFEPIVEINETEETSIFDIATYICFYSKKLLGEDYDVTNMKLNKLLYYSQMEHIGTFGTPLFTDTIEAWTHGPVCPNVYHKYKALGSHIIDCKSSDVRKLPNDKINIITKVLERYGKQSAYQLRQKTHQELPWQIAFKKGSNSIISLDDLKVTFEDNRFLNLF